VTARRNPAPAEPLRLFAIVNTNGGAPGAWHPVRSAAPGSTAAIEAVHAFISEADAWRFLLGDAPVDPGHEHAMRAAWRVVPLVADRRTP